MSGPEEVAMWEKTVKSAQERTRVALDEETVVMGRLKTVQNELAVAEKKLAGIKAAIQEILGLAGA